MKQNELGTVVLTYEGKKQQLEKFDSCVIPEKQAFAFSAWTNDLEMICVTLPGTLQLD